MADEQDDAPTPSVTIIAPQAAAPVAAPPAPALLSAALPVSRADPRYPSDSKRTVRLLRFAQLLDDEKNALSPVKLNVWAANLGAISTVAATIASWVGGHIGGIESLWAGSIGWLTQAHATHHLDKRERNLQKTRMGGGL